MPLNEKQTQELVEALAPLTQPAKPPAPPSGMKLVSQDEFFKALCADPRDIMPSHQEPLFTTWETKSRQVWGWSYPGWRNVGAPKLWAIQNS